MNLPDFLGLVLGGMVTVGGGWFVFEVMVDWFFGGAAAASDEKELS